MKNFPLIQKQPELQYSEPMANYGRGVGYQDGSFYVQR